MGRMRSGPPELFQRAIPAPASPYLIPGSVFLTSRFVHLSRTSRWGIREGRNRLAASASA